MKKFTFYFIAEILVIIITFTAYFIFFTCSDHYTVICYNLGSKSKEIKNIPCDSDNDCSVKSMASYCAPDYPDLLKCACGKYYCGNDGYCRGCNAYVCNKGNDYSDYFHDKNINFNK